MKILAFESSCDETAVAVVEDGRKILSDAIASQADLHALYGGIFLITALEILNSTLVWFCPKYAQLLLGKPVTIIRNGEILQDELAQLRITASDLAEALRGKDIFSPKDVYWGVIEPNGSITAAPMPQDGGEPPMLPLLIDKAVYKENLAFFGMDTAALDALLRREQTTREAVLLLLYNGKKSILIQKKAAPKGAA